MRTFESMRSLKLIVVYSFTKQGASGAPTMVSTVTPGLRIAWIF
jgi:hypothetical protein